MPQSQLIFFDDANWWGLLPLTFTRPIADLRIGIDTVKEKWLSALDAETYSFLSVDHLQAKFPYNTLGDDLYVNGSVLPTKEVVRAVSDLLEGQALVLANEAQETGSLLACRKGENEISFNAVADGHRIPDVSGFEKILYSGEIEQITRPYHLFQMNGDWIARDFERLTSGKTSADLSDTNTLIGNPEQLYISPTATVEGAILNVKKGPIYIGDEVEIMEGSVIRGAFAAIDHAVVKLGAKIYGATTLGPYVKVGGELNNCVFQAYSNKGHDGFIGNAAIGEWCNIGADTNASNLKNNYGNVRVWNYATDSFEKSGLQFCGLIMGDHAKCGINTMFNTATVVGVAANVFGGGFPRKFIYSFAWGGAQGYQTFRLQKVFEMAEAMMGRRGIPLTDVDKKILTHLFKMTADKRTWDKKFE